MPLKVARDAVATLNLSAVVAEVGNRNALSDAGASAFLAQAGLRGAALNVRANARELQDRAVAEAWLKELSGLEARATDALGAMDRLQRDRR